RAPPLPSWKEPPAGPTPLPNRGPLAPVPAPRALAGAVIRPAAKPIPPSATAIASASATLTQVELRPRPRVLTPVATTGSVGVPGSAVPGSAVPVPVGGPGSGPG